MIRLELAGPHTRLLSTLCAQCPQGPAGCCVSPPEMDWSDLGRIVALGGLDWLLDQLARGHLSPAARGLRIRRERRRGSSREPRRSKCVYHGPEGCTIAHERRSATCNYFVCEDVFVDGGERRRAPEALASREAHGRLMRIYTRWDEEMSRRIAAAWPEGPPWDAAFLGWLGAEFDRLSAGSSEELRALAAP
jgi:hypothetical protein